MLTWLFALWAAASPAQVPVDAGAQYIVRAWGTNEGLPQNTVTAIVQTRDGYLWLGTFGGLVRFDGLTFTVFDPGNSPGLASARITALHEDSQRVLWIGTEAGLTKLEQGRFTSYGIRRVGERPRRRRVPRRLRPRIGLPARDDDGDVRRDRQARQPE